MSAVNLSFRGGARMKAYLAGLQAAVGGASGVRVGFLEDATYPARATESGGEAPMLHIAQVAFWNEFGTSRAPARPFFRSMIEREFSDWGDELGAALRANGFDSQRALSLMGVSIQDDLKSSINEWPADNAPATVALKGFNKGLVWSGQMLRAADFEVLE